MARIYLYLFFLSSNFVGYSQDIHCKLFSRSDSSKVPYASILFENKKVGFHSDEFGRFTLRSSQMIDTIKIRSIGFQDTLLIVEKSKVKGELLIYLSVKSIILPEFRIYSDNKPYTSKKPKKTGALQQWGGVGSQYGLLLDDEKLMGRKMLKAHFYLAHGGKPRYPFRIRIYSIKYGKPNKELSKEGIIAQATHQGWNEFDISQYDIYVPEGGCLLAMEWLNFENTLPAELIQTKGKYPGQILGMGDFGNRYLGFVKDDFSSWQYNGDYLPSYPLPEKDKFMNPMIRLTVK